MGMAASQARLLSITSRMADNELRAQIANNAKMRLAADSSRISADYVNALNNATMMISNYNEDGDSQFSKLTFNKLTEYSPFNTQYGLANTYGQLLVNENEAKIFEAAGGSLTKFLEAHDLKFGTSYFNPESFNGESSIKFEDENGNVIGNFALKDLEAMYFGGTTSDGIEHKGFEDNYDLYNSFVNQISNFSVAYNRCQNDTDIIKSYVDPEIKQQVDKFGREYLGYSSSTSIYDEYRNYATGKVNLNEENCKEKVFNLLKLIEDISKDGDGKYNATTYVTGATTNYYDNAASVYLKSDGSLETDLEKLGFNKVQINNKTYYVFGEDEGEKMQTMANTCCKDNGKYIDINGVQWGVASGWMDPSGHGDIDINNTYLIKVTDSNYTPAGNGRNTYKAHENMPPGYIAISRTSDGNVYMLYGQNSTDDKVWTYCDGNKTYQKIVENLEVGAAPHAIELDQRGQGNGLTVEYDDALLIHLGKYTYDPTSPTKQAISGVLGTTNGITNIIQTNVNSATAFDGSGFDLYLQEMLKNNGVKDFSYMALPPSSGWFSNYETLKYYAEDYEYSSGVKGNDAIRHLASAYWYYNALGTLTGDLPGYAQPSDANGNYTATVKDLVDHNYETSGFYERNAGRIYLGDKHGDGEMYLQKFVEQSEFDANWFSGYDQKVLKATAATYFCLKELTKDAANSVNARISATTPGANSVEDAFIFTTGDSGWINDAGDKEYHQMSWDGEHFCVDPSGQYLSKKNGVQLNTDLIYYAFDKNNKLRKYTAYSSEQSWQNLLVTLAEETFGHCAFTTDSGETEDATEGNYHYTVNILEYIEKAAKGDATHDPNANAKAAEEMRLNILAKYGVDLQGVETDDFTYIGGYASQLAAAGRHGDETQQSIYDNYVLNCLFDIYGEPNMTWIDTKHPESDAEAKVNWYTNLFQRMSQGYKVLEDGLARSNEWIEFALESGLVSVEQVDKANKWNGTTHTNVASITEVTDEVAVARAEAEYKKAMNEVEHKDKRIDIELKNIDTEHSALQTEYDSVKNVISKNVERSFKIYNA